MKYRSVFFLVLLFLCCCSLAGAEPLLTNGNVTTYIGENNYMYLESADGSLHRLQAPIRDLLGMDSQNLYCLTYDNKIYAVRLDGSSSSLVSANASPEQIEARRNQSGYALSDRLLTRSGEQVKIALSATCLAACSNHDTIFFLQQDPVSGAVTLHAAPLEFQATVFSSPLEGLPSITPVYMSASRDAVCVLGVDKSIRVYSIANAAVQTIEASQITDDIAYAVCVSGKILTYTADENGYPRIAGSYDVSLDTGLPLVVVKTSVPTSTPVPTAVIITPAPTVRQTATRRPSTPEPDPDETIYYGSRGTRVRKMQQRLLNLGYPVGNVDGSFGEQTLFALNLFQDAIGYTNRKSCTSKCYSRLMAKSAPKFDLYRPLKKGNRGISVELMQKMLILLGYGPDKADGIYGDNTSAAVAAFQFYAALPVDGDNASANTLFALYTLMNPLESPTPTPIPTLTPVPTMVPETVSPTATAQPTQTNTVEPPPTTVPTEIPTSAPTDHPTGTPTDSPEVDPTQAPTATPAPESTGTPTSEPVELITPEPTEKPTEEPTQGPTEKPTEEPTQAPTEKPTEEPTQAPTEKPTEAPTAEPTTAPTEALVELITPKPAETDPQSPDA